MGFVYQFLHILGSLGLLVFGMRLLSEGIQRAAGDRLQAILHLLTTNRFTAIFTGFLITVLVQSSSASTVMIVSFVNASLLTLTQAIGAIMGANIGTTVTGWIVAVFGFSVNISGAALPAIGIGAVLVFNKKLRRTDVGEVFIGFGLLFLGLSFLKDAVPDIGANPELLERIASLGGHGFLSILLFLLFGALLTVIVQSSSAAVTITLTMAFAGWIDFPTSAAIILGENIGTTITANLAAMGGSRNGVRAARAHLLFNVVGVLWMLAFFPFFLRLVDIIVPGSPYDLSVIHVLPAHLAMFHTVFNLLNTLVFVGFIPLLARLTVRLVPGSDEHDLNGPYVLPVQSRYAQGTVELYLMEVRHEIVRMAGIVETMIQSAWALFENPDAEDADKRLEACRIEEEYTDQMQEQLSAFLARFSTESLSDATATSIASLLRIIDELEGIADSSYNVALIADRRRRKKLKVGEAAMEELRPYAELVQEFVGFIDGRMLDTIDDEALQQAHGIERSINKYRNKLKKSARKRIQKGADVRAELVVIDIVGHFEHMGDYSLNVAQALRQMNPRRTMQASLRLAPEGSPPQDES